MPHILYLSYDGMTDPLGQSQVIPYLQGLSKKGYQFTIISFEKKKRFQTEGKKIKLLLSKSNIRWIPLRYHKSPSVLSTMFDLWLMKVNTQRLHREQAFDIIHCRSYLSALIGLSIKKKFNTKFLFDMRGFWADERLEGGIWNINNPIYKLIYRYFKRKEKTFFEQADYTISLTELAKREIQNWQHIKANIIPIKVIPCCADLDHFSIENSNKMKRDHIKKKLGIRDDELILLYLGSLGSWYMLDEMLDFFKRLLQYKSNCRFLIISKDKPDMILSSARIKGIKAESLLIISVDRNELPDYLCCADLSIFFIKPIFSKKASSPTKQGELMGMGIPIICNSGVGDTSEIILNTGAGAVIAEFSDQEYHRICQQLDSLLQIDPRKIRAGAENYYALKKGIKAYSQVYDSILNKKKLV